jgi:hypothetical protein
MSTEFRVQPPVAYASLYQAGCRREPKNEKVLGRGTNSEYFPMKMPNDHYVWVTLDNKRVAYFTRFGGNDPEWIISFCNEHGSSCISEYEEEFWDNNER